jgi:hypothetical protein
MARWPHGCSSTRKRKHARAEAEPPLGRARAAALGHLGRAPPPHTLEAAGVVDGEAKTAARGAIFSLRGRSAGRAEASWPLGPRSNSALALAQPRPSSRLPIRSGRSLTSSPHDFPPPAGLPSPSKLALAARSLAGAARGAPAPTAVFSSALRPANPGPLPAPATAARLRIERMPAPAARCLAPR